MVRRNEILLTFLSSFNSLYVLQKREREREIEKVPIRACKTRKTYRDEIKHEKGDEFLQRARRFIFSNAFALDYAGIRASAPETAKGKSTLIRNVNASVTRENAPEIHSSSYSLSLVTIRVSNLNPFDARPESFARPEIKRLESRD